MQIVLEILQIIADVSDIQIKHEIVLEIQCITMSQRVLWLIVMHWDLQYNLYEIFTSISNTISYPKMSLK